MSTLKTQINDDVKSAMKAKEVFKRNTLRLLTSAMKQIEVDERIELSNEDIIKIIQKEIKKRNDSATQYKDAGRNDLYEQEVNEIAILEVYLPKQLNDDDLKNVIASVIEEIGAKNMKDMGKVMGIANAKLAGSADGKRISEIVKALLK
jgi:uncharacterized protein YqeY